jgi:hypothetical protein
MEANLKELYDANVLLQNNHLSLSGGDFSGERAAVLHSAGSLFDNQNVRLSGIDKFEDHIKALQTPTAPGPPGNSITLPQFLPLSAYHLFPPTSFLKIASTITIKLETNCGGDGLMREGKGSWCDWVVESVQNPFCLMVGEVLDYHSFDVAGQ